MIVFIIDVVAAFLLCLYFANGKLVLFQKGGFGLWRSNRNQVLSEETTEENQGEVLMPRVSFRQRLGNFKSNPRLWIFWNKYYYCGICFLCLASESSY